MPPEIDLTPSPRVLLMLGKIEFKGWQCLAELIDNAIDAYPTDGSHGHPEVRINLPPLRDLTAGTGEISVKDSGRGMNASDLANAVRAGYSGNDPLSKLGLFGMGFNIATARLGRVTEVWTTRRGDPDWVGVRIDFDHLQRTGQFRTPQLTRPKTDTSKSGTEVYIQKLDGDQVRRIVVGQGKTRLLLDLARVYSFCAKQRGLAININGDEIPTWSHCVWSSTRSVQTARFGTVPAILEVDKDFGPGLYCKACWNWIDSESSPPVSCPLCQTPGSVIRRDRQMRGWVGVQRFYDKAHFGIDFIRNGRVISPLDKTPFRWTNPETEEEKEDYPLDATFWGGRIVGQIECDFVRVSHMKDSFDTSDPNWRKVLSFLHGEGPLEPKHEYYDAHPQSESPLERLFVGYRYGRPPGIRYLIPGDESGGAINTLPKEWAQRYWASDPEYQSDQKWWDAVIVGDEANRRTKGLPPTRGGPTASGPNASAPGSPAGPEGDATPPIEGPPTTSSGTTPVISQDYVVPGIEVQPVKVEVFSQPGGSAGGYALTPKDIERRSLQFWYDPEDSFFEEFPEEVADLVLVEVAHALCLRAGGGATPGTNVGQLYAELKKKYRNDARLDIQALGESARQLMTEMRDYLAEILGAMHVPPPTLPSREMDAIRRAVSEQGQGEPEVRRLLESGSYVKYMPLGFSLDLLDMYSSQLLDGGFWSRAYSTLASDNLKSETLAEMRSLLEDVLWLWRRSQESPAQPSRPWKLRLARASTSLRLLEEWRASRSVRVSRS